MHHIHAGRAPQYLSDCVSTVSALGGRYRLRSTGSADYVLPRTRTKFGERGFSYCGPAAWNTLPSDLHDITDTDTFRKRLKSVLFDRAYHWLLLALLDVSYSGALQIWRLSYVDRTCFVDSDVQNENRDSILAAIQQLMFPVRWTATVQELLQTC